MSLGGLGLPPSSIGNILSAFGVLNGLSQIFLFPRINERFGTKATFLAGVASCVPLFACFPLMSHLVKAQGLSPAVWAVVTVQTFLSIGMSFGYGEIPPFCLFLIHGLS